MAFAADAIADVIAPPAQAPSSPAAAIEDGARFKEHLDQHAESAEAQPRPRQRAAREPSEKEPPPENAAQQQAPPPANQPPQQSATLTQIIANMTGAGEVKTESGAPKSDAEGVAPAKGDATELPAAQAAPQSPALATPTVCAPSVSAQSTADTGKSVQTKDVSPTKPTREVKDPTASTPAPSDAQSNAAANAEATQRDAKLAQQQAPVVEAAVAASIAPIITAPNTQAAQQTPQRVAATRPDRIDDNATPVRPEMAAQLQQSDTARPVRPVAQAQSRASREAFAEQLAANMNADAPQVQSQTPSADGARAHTISSLTGTQAAHATSDAATSAATRASPLAAQVGHEIVRRFNGDSTRFELRLDPPELGRVDVRLDVSRDHRVTAVISADNPQALSDLARASRDLEQALQSAGLQLADNGLSFDLTNRGDTSAQAQANNGHGGRQASGDVITDETPVSARPRLERWQGSRLDVIV